MYSKFLDGTICCLERVLMVLLGSSIVVVSLQIIFRYVLGSPLNWSEQVARGIFIWLTMLSVPLLVRRKGAVAFDLLVGLLPKRAQLFFEVIVQLLVLFFAGYFFIFSLTLCIETGNRLMAGVRIPQNIIYISAPIAMFVLVLVVVEQIVKNIKIVKGWGK